MRRKLRDGRRGAGERRHQRQRELAVGRGRQDDARLQEGRLQGRPRTRDRGAQGRTASVKRQWGAAKKTFILLEPD